jgi:SAM-dependent methyltransferase
MNTHELGLLLAHQLADVEDLHYGYWELDQEPSLDRIQEAQDRYSDVVVEAVEHALDGRRAGRLLDIGCGTGKLLLRLLADGYRADAVTPSEYFHERLVRKIEEQRPAYRPHVFLCTLEELPVDELAGAYELCLFSESFQYMWIKRSLPRLRRLLAPQGRVVICDFFKTERHGDGGLGDRAFGGGHPIQDFYRFVEEYRFRLIEDVDITAHISPSVELLDRLMRERGIPAVDSLTRFVRSRYPILSKAAAIVFRRPLGRIRYNYLSGHRNKATFERYKSYRLIVMEPIR